MTWIDARGGGLISAFGHSAGGTALLLAAARRPGRFDRLYCYEPIAFNPELRGTFDLPGPLVHAARRRAQFASREEALEYFAVRPPLSGLDPRALRGYIEGGLIDAPEGGVRLACDPAFEASVYRAGYDEDVSGELSLVDCPVTVAYGGASEGFGPACAPHVAAALPGGQLVRVEGLGHLGPLEEPEAVAASVITAFDTPRT